MNPFKTDHPLSSKVGVQVHPTISFFFRTLTLALILTPFVLIRLYYYAIGDIGAEPNPFPRPWWALFWGIVIAFVISSVVAILIASMCRIFARRFSLGDSTRIVG